MAERERENESKKGLESSQNQNHPKSCVFAYSSEKRKSALRFVAHRKILGDGPEKRKGLRE